MILSFIKTSKALPFLLETFFKFKDIKINIIHNDVVVSAYEKKYFHRPIP